LLYFPSENIRDFVSLGYLAGMLMNNVVWVGIDPGADGGIALIEGETVRTWPMPLGEVVNQKQAVDSDKLRMIFGAIYRHRPHIRMAMEDNYQWKATTNARAFAFGHSVGVVSALVAMIGVEPLMLSANRSSHWARDHLGVGTSKRERIAAALALYPSLGRVTDGEADAVLIAHVMRLIDAPQSVPEPIPAPAAVSLCEILGRDTAPEFAI
jgi:Holliday junction resolvasome RuvABC endonuclease subunit